MPLPASTTGAAPALPAPLARYLDGPYLSIRGMSSLFAARICAHVVVRQTALGIRGQIVEIGAFKGRFFIALALGLAEGEHAVAIDTFDWPNDRVEAEFRANCKANGLPREDFTSLKANTGAMSADDFARPLKGEKARFIHIDGEHSYEALTKDLVLAHEVLHPQGLICLDDMLHPGYPLLVVAVHDYLKSHPEMVVMAILDREDIVAAAKFLICRKDAVALYESDLMESFPEYHYVVGGDPMGHFCVVLTPEPRLAEVD